MSNKHGDFIWYELLTPDADAAQDFYGNILGWNFVDSEQSDVDYRLFSINGTQIGGLMPISEEMRSHGARPVWLGYIAVDDVDASVDAITKFGGKVEMSAMEIPNVGRIAMVTDPQGAPFYVMKAIPPEGNPDAISTSFAATEPMIGHCAWNELASDNPQAAKQFYGDLFGWQPNGDMDMGPMGKYEFWKVGDDRGFMIGGVMPKMPQMPVSLWTYYFRVADIDVAVKSIKSNGGNILQEPIEIPGGDFSLVGMDPQGASFGLVGPRL